ncbi:MAG TPA: hypothetical protein VFO35_10380 [Steroidobacteraceae bacterium]|nr:hypothetical protein [Steroidobacteraceae bacterium]
MDLTYLMLTGGLSGLVSVLLHSIVASARTSIHPGAAAAPLQASDAVLHMLYGTGFALLFWLSWGLAAVVDVPWWVRGLSFGSLCWVSFAVPGVVGIALSRGLPIAATAEAATRWATTSVIAGLACAWSWERML